MLLNGVNMKKSEWKDLEIECMRLKDEVDRFQLFSNSIRDKENNILYVGQLLQRACFLYPDNIALIYLDRKISYKELYHRSVLFSKKLLSLGIKSKDRILLFMPNSLDFYVAYFGVLQIGAVIAPLNVFLKERELTHIVSDSNPELIISYSDKVELFNKNSKNIILTEKDLDLESRLSENCPEFEPRCLSENDLSVLLYTSGTTGLPKGVMLSSKNIMTNVVQTVARMPLCKVQRIFCVLPLFHSFAQNTCIWSAFFAGCSVIVVKKIERRGIFQGLQYKPTIFLGVPALYGLLCLLKKAPIFDVEYFISGGDALPDKISSAFQLIYRRKLCNGYGLTETSPLISVDLEDVSEPINNVGRPVLGVKCSIRDENGIEISNEDIGMLWVKGDNVMIGYYKLPKTTKSVVKDGWFCTGDLAKFDSNGKLLICGRDKDLIIHKGFNIYPQEIENTILSHMAVMFVGVIGKPDEMSGEIPIAFVQLNSGTNEEGMERELLDLCKKNLANYKIPRSFIFLKDIPLTATKKVDKKVLREQLKK